MVFLGGVVVGAYVVITKLESEIECMSDIIDYLTTNAFLKASLVIMIFALLFLTGTKIGYPSGKFFYYLSH